MTKIFEHYMYKEKNIFGMEKGRKPFLFMFWVRRIRKLVPDHSRLLEVGCGLGFLLRRLEKHYEITGYDYSLKAMSEIKNNIKASLIVGNAQKLTFDKESFEAIVCFDVVEHLEQPELFFAEAERTLKSRGYLFFSTCNPDSFGCKIKLKPDKDQKIDYLKDIYISAAYKEVTHINIRKIIDWQEILRQNDFEIISDGTDTLWDVPYFRLIPVFIQKLIFIPVHYLISYFFGYLPWKYGENYVCIARKKR
jgi:2-polyprenyl-3-methyl-5-hydroxy-6-metoxy-1,4-benzoquinol methylase